ncbi:TetR/AcrR family transcriptional regulator [bacterium]|nr:TetR/AcrR family transcriptional regulator [bacterium]
MRTTKHHRLRGDGKETRRSILKIAVNTASEKGLEGLSIGDLADRLRMSKSGLFAHFGSKTDLQMATVQEARDIFVREVVEPYAHTERGLKRLRAMMESWLSYVERRVFSGGCFFFHASAEFDARSGPVRDEIAKLTKAWLDAISEEIREAKQRQEIDSKVDPAQMAFELHAYVQEANWANELLGEKKAFDYARRAIRRRIDLSTKNSSKRKI